MAQDAIRDGKLQVINICNMKEKAPGYVGQRANELALEILQLSDDCLTIIDQSEIGWAEFAIDLKAVLEGNYSTTIPSGPVEVTAEHERIAKEALVFLKKSGGLVRLVNVASMHMYQGWPNLYEFMKLGLTPVFVGSNQFQEEMARILQRDINKAYDWLKEFGLKFEYKSGGLTRKEIDLALRMYLVKLGWWNDGVLGMGTQGQMEQIRVVATDLSETLMMSSYSPGKNVPVIDVTEADCEALVSSLLAQAIIFVKTGQMFPVGFHDIRHYNVAEDTLVLLNSGALALDFMTDTVGDYSDITAVSQNRQVYFLNGGACVYGNMRPSKEQFAFQASRKRFHLYYEGGKDGYPALELGKAARSLRRAGPLANGYCTDAQWRDEGYDPQLGAEPRPARGNGYSARACRCVQHSRLWVPMFRIIEQVSFGRTMPSCVFCARALFLYFICNFY